MTDDELVRRARLRGELEAAPKCPHWTRPKFETVEKAEAKKQGFYSLTFGYAIRLESQCNQLLKAINDLRGVKFLLVREGSRISIWRQKPAPDTASHR